MAYSYALCTLSLSLLITTISLILSPMPVDAQLSVSFYANTCPSVFDTVRSGVKSAINREARMGASIMRLFFHDCFVNGCDGGILLDDTGSFVGEKTAFPNTNGSARGFEVIDSLKTQVDRACGGSVVSCADILAIAARDSVVELGGPTYSIPVGRRDARTASRDRANSDLPGPGEDLASITGKFSNKGLNQREMVVLSGAHTVGQARCVTFRARIYSSTSNIDASFATMRQATCPQTGGDNNLAPLDPQSPNRFGNNYYQALINKRGLLNSDQVLFNGGATDSIVTTYSNDANTFNSDFGNAMIKMGNISPLTGTQGEIRTNCRRMN